MILDKEDIGKRVSIVGGAYAGAEGRIRYRVRKGHPKEGPEFDVWRVILLNGPPDRPDKAGITTSLYAWKLKLIEAGEPNLEFRLHKIKRTQYGSVDAKMRRW